VCVNLNPVKVYHDAFSMKQTHHYKWKQKTNIFGVYMLKNLITGDISGGQSVNLSKKFWNYF